MVRNKVLICIIFLFTIGAVSATDFEINFLRDVYGGMDSVQVMILNNLTLINDVGFGNIKLYNNSEGIPLALNLHKTDYGYFIFFDLPNLKNGSYSFFIKDLMYYDKSVLRKGNFSKDLVVENLNYSLSVYPMFVDLSLEYWEKPKLTFKLKNHFDKVNVSVSGKGFVKPRVNEIILNKGEGYNLIVDIDQGIVEGFDSKEDLILDYGYRYEIPIYLHKKVKIGLIENKTVVKENFSIIKDGLKFIEGIDKVNRTLKKETILEGALRFKNFANVSLHGLEFNLTDDLNEIIRLEYKGLDFVGSNEERYVVLFVNEDKNINKDYKGRLIITTKEGVSAEIPIYLYFEEVFIRNETVREENFSFNYTAPKIEEKKSNLALIIVAVVFIGLLIVVVSYFYRKGKPKKKEFEELFR